MGDLSYEATTDRERHYIEIYKDWDIDALNAELASIEKEGKSLESDLEDPDIHYDNEREANLNIQMLSEKKRIVEAVIRYKQKSVDQTLEHTDGDRVR